MENKLPDILNEFKRGNLPDEGIKKMTEIAKALMSRYK
jgi:F-type H+-transporting ATPase subunit alpha